MIYDTFSERLRRQQHAGEPDVYIYNAIPALLRRQVCLILKESIGDCEDRTSKSVWRQIYDISHRELLSFTPDAYSGTWAFRVMAFLSDATSVNEFLDVLEMSLSLLLWVNSKEPYAARRGATIEAPAAIDEINTRFQRQSVGYQYENGNIIRVDSEVTHAEIIKPALMLLRLSIFAKANKDFMEAHKHYRDGDYRASVTASNRAFESTLKAICDTKGWVYKNGDRASDLVNKVRSKGLFKHDFSKSMDPFIAMLKTGLPVVRNEAGAHGESITSSETTSEIARFALNLTASNILFLGACFEAL